MFSYMTASYDIHALFDGLFHQLFIVRANQAFISLIAGVP